MKFHRNVFSLSGVKKISPGEAVESQLKFLMGLSQPDQIYFEYCDDTVLYIRSKDVKTTLLCRDNDDDDDDDDDFPSL